jgi:hypothetical protein
MWVCGLLLIMALALGQTGSAQPPELDELMQRKLDNAQWLLEAVVMADHEAVERFTTELIRISETSLWSPWLEPDYGHYAVDFREAAGLVIDNAQDRSVDGVALSYMQLTLNCVRCHKRVRER